MSRLEELQRMEKLLEPFTDEGVLRDLDGIRLEIKQLEMADRLAELASWDEYPPMSKDLADAAALLKGENPYVD